jgi:2-dehydropantoate 2-reductase
MFSGTVIRLGRELGIATPVNQVLYSGIKVLEEKYGCK